jgi:DnaJ-class molecular chaperone
MQTAGTAAQGIFMDATTGATTGDLLNLNNNGVRKMRLRANGDTIVSANNAAPSSSLQHNSSLTFWLDEAGNNLKVQVRYSNGTVKTATVAVV